MKSRGFKTLVSALLALGANYVMAPTAWSEGNIDFTNARGVNRVVRTDPGYIAADGTVNCDFWMPSDVDAQGNATFAGPRVNRYDNKPTAYLGGTGAFYHAVNGQVVNAGTAEVDAGLQFETAIWSPQGVLGWSAFISNSKASETAADANRVFLSSAGLYTPVRVWNADDNQWVVWRGRTPSDRIGPINSYMRYDLTTDGRARLILDAFGWPNITNPNQTTPDTPNGLFWNQEVVEEGQAPNITYKLKFQAPDVNEALVNGHRIAPWYGDRIFDTTRNNEATIKRVVGMTRAYADDATQGGRLLGEAQLDGSLMVCDFTGGRIAAAGQAFGTWTAGATMQVDPNDPQRGTGYDAPGNGTATNTNHAAYDLRWPWSNPPGANGRRTYLSRTIVEFLPVGTRDFDADFNYQARRGTDNYGVVSRYANETVRINLRTATRPVGQPLEYNTSTP